MKIFDSLEDELNDNANLYLENLDLKHKLEVSEQKINIIIDIINEQPTGNDEWLLQRLNGIVNDLKGEENERRIV